MFLTSRSILQTKLTAPVVWWILNIYLHVSNLTINFTNKTDCSSNLVNSIYIYLHVSNLTINFTNKTDCSSSLVNSIYIYIYMFLTSRSILHTTPTAPVVWWILNIYLHVSYLTINFTNKTDCSRGLVLIKIYLHVSNLTINFTNKTDCSSSLVNSKYIFTCF